MVSKHHDLKADPDVFEASLAGNKPWEIRRNDRNFKVGDRVTLRETFHTGAEMEEGESLAYTGRKIGGVISYVMHGPSYGLIHGWVIFTYSNGGSTDGE